MSRPLSTREQPTCRLCSAPLTDEEHDLCSRCREQQTSADPADRTLAMSADDQRTELRPPGPEHPQLAVGSSIGAYKIVDILGRGGMGEVYRGEHSQLQRPVAVKALPPEMVRDPMRRERLLREARASSALNHPNIVTVHDFFTEGDRDFIVMEMVEGTTLTHLLRSRRLDLAEALGYAEQIADALAAAHAAGIVHRDLKPDNVMITPAGRVKLMDFGLAKVDSESDGGEEALTRLGTVLGTLGYMSPEQAQGETVGPPSDIFSLGIVLYEMLAGRHPFRGDSSVETLHRICFSSPPVERDLSPLPTPLRELVAGCLAKSPEARPTANALLAALSDAKTTDLRQAPLVSDRPPRLARSWLWRAAGGAALVAAAAVGWWLWPTRDTAPPASDPPGSAIAAAETPWELTEAGFGLLERHYRRGVRDRAVAAFQAALGRDNEFAPAYAGLAWAHFLAHEESGDPQLLEMALQNAREAVRLNPQLAIGQVYLGAVLTKRDETDAARQALSEALLLDPESAAAHREMGMLLSQEGEPERALRELETALALAPDDWFTHLSHGLVLYDSANYPAAETAFQRAADLAPDSYEPFRNLAAAYQKQGRYDEAAAALQESLKHRPVASVYTNLGNIFYFQGLYQKAASAFEKSLELGPNNYLRWANLGDAYRRIPGEEETAAQAYERAIQLLRPQLAESPADATLQSRLALYLAQQGSKAEALAEAERSLALGDSSAAVHYRLLLAFELAGDRESALEALDATLTAGYPLDQIQREPELSNLRQDVRFHRIVQRWASEARQSEGETK